MRTFRLAATAALALSLAACTPAVLRGHLPADSGKPACTGAVVTVADGQPTACDVKPPQRLDVIMPTAASSVERCDDMGGELIADSASLSTATYATCEGVDY